MSARRITAVAFSSMFAACSVAPAPAPAPPDERGGCVAILVDRTFGSHRETFSNPRGGILGSSSPGKGMRLEVARRYSIELGFADRDPVKVEREFPAGTTIAEVASELAHGLRAQGLDVAVVPEFGALRVGFMPGLNLVQAAAIDGFTILDHMGPRSEVVREGAVVEDLR